SQEQQLAEVALVQWETGNFSAGEMPATSGLLRSFCSRRQQLDGLALFGKFEPGGQRGSISKDDGTGRIPGLAGDAYGDFVGPDRDFGERKFSACRSRGGKFKASRRCVQPYRRIAERIPRRIAQHTMPGSRGERVG